MGGGIGEGEGEGRGGGIGGGLGGGSGGGMVHVRVRRVEGGVSGEGKEW